MQTETNGENTALDVLGLQVALYWKKQITLSVSKKIVHLFRRWNPGERVKPPESGVLLPRVENFYFDQNLSEF